jgi:phosphatidylglycerophosphate synthase
MLSSRVPVALYVPNILCYIRILTAFLGLWFVKDQPVLALTIWILSAALDLFDGVLARALHQTSTLGILLDVCADTILRTCIWMAAMMVYSDTSKLTVLLTCLVVSTEWFTFAATQIHSRGRHWKVAREKDPWFVRKVFEGGFKTPIGCWTIYGLFAAPMFLWGSAHPVFVENIPLFNFWKYAAYTGRVYAFSVEVYLSCSYLAHVIDQDTKQREHEEQSKKET